MKKLTVKDYLTSSNRFPDREALADNEVRTNAEILLSKVNALLEEIAWSEPLSISSGFRPAAVNANVPGAAKKSAHITGLALDLYQPKENNKLGALIRATHKANGLLKRHGLMMEALEVTVGQNSNWVHLDMVPRSDRSNREFRP